MAQLEPPSAQAIFDRVNLNAAAFGRDDDSDVLLVIANLLRTAARSANAQVDMASLPFDFPFDDGTLALAFPLKSADQRGETTADQQGEISEWIADQVSYELIRSARPRGTNTVNGDTYLQKAKDFKDSAEQHRQVALELIRQVVTLTQEGQNLQAEEDRSKHIRSPRMQGETRTYADSIGYLVDDLVP